MRKPYGIVAIAALTTVLLACVFEPTKPTTPPAQAAASYTQFIDATNDKTPVDISKLPLAARQECMANPAPTIAPLSAGINLLTSIGTTLSALIATEAVNEIQKWVSDQIAQYSITVVGKPVRLGFYSPALWFKKPGSADQYSCLAIAVAKCDTHGSEQTKCTDPQNTRIVIIAQYRLTSEFLQVRPLAAYVKGFDAKRSAGDASIAATLKLESVWWDGHQGQTWTLPSMDILSVKFVPTADDATAPAALAMFGKGKNEDGNGTLDPMSWNSRPALPRPPQTAGSEGTVTITPTVAEANLPPKSLANLEKLFGQHASAMSDALKSALTSLLPSKQPEKK